MIYQSKPLLSIYISFIKPTKILLCYFHLEDEIY